MLTTFKSTADSMKQKIESLDKEHIGLLQSNLKQKQKREGLKSTSFRDQIKYQKSSDEHSKLDNEISEFVNKALSDELTMLYQLDIGLLNQINDGSNPKLDELARQLASSKIAAMQRGKKDRKEFKEYKEKKFRAIMIIQRYLIRRRIRKRAQQNKDAHLKQKDAKLK